MRVEVLEHGEAINDKRPLSKPVGSEQHARSVATLNAIACSKCSRSNVVRGVLPVEQIMRDHLPVVVRVQNALSLQSLEQSMRFGYALFVVKPVVEPVA